jgi:hypothetical protein
MSESILNGKRILAVDDEPDILGVPKEKMEEIVPFLEDILESVDGPTAWGKLMNKLEGYFTSRWGDLWKKSEEKFWKDFDNKTKTKRG